MVAFVNGQASLWYGDLVISIVSGRFFRSVSVRVNLMLLLSDSCLVSRVTFKANWDGECNSCGIASCFVESTNKVSKIPRDCYNYLELGLSDCAVISMSGTQGGESLMSIRTETGLPPVMLDEPQ